MTPDEAIAKLTNHQRATLLKLWGPVDGLASTIDDNDILALRLQGLIRKREDGLTEFTDLGRAVCERLGPEQ